MGIAVGRNKILLHLQTDRSINDYKETPYQFCQKGIAEAVDLSQSRTSLILKELIEADLIKEDTSHITGLVRRRKVYSLTPKGLKKAREIRTELENEKVIIKESTSKIEVELDEIESYINSKKDQEPLLVALNKVNENGVIDLTNKKEQKKEVFTGRSEEMNILLDNLDRVKNKQSLTILIKGEAGIGKTTLINELKKKAASNVFSFLTGKGFYETSEPYLPFKDAFKQYESKNGTSTPLEFSKNDKNSLGINIYEEDEEKKRNLIFSETVENIKIMAQINPLIIFIDDLQWADKATLMFFHYLSVRLEDAPVLLIGAFRSQNVIDDDNFLIEVLQRMRKEGISAEIELPPLTFEDTKNIVQGLTAKSDVSDELVQQIYEVSEGNPLFSREVVKQIIEECTIDAEYNKSQLDIINIGLPQVIEDIIEKRVNRLEQEQIKVLQKGAIIGERIRYSLLKLITDLKPFDLLESLDILIDSELWHVGSSEDSFYFSHGLIQQYVYNRIPKAIRKDLHRRVANSIEKEFEGSLEDYFSDIGYHYDKANEISKAFEYYRKAGEKAKLVYAHKDAIALFKKALKLLEKKCLGKKKKWGIIEKIGDMKKIIGDYDVSLEYYKRIPLEEIELEFQKRIHRKIASVYERKGEYDKALDEINKGILEQHGKSIETARLLGKKGLIEMRKGEYDLAEYDFLESLKISENYGYDKETADVYYGLGTVYTRKGKYDEALNHLKKSLRMREEIEDLIGTASSLSGIGNIYSKRGELDRALGLYNDSLEIWEKIGDKGSIAKTLNNIGTMYSKKGQLEKGIKYYQRSYEICKKIGDKRAIAISLLNVGINELKMGELNEALQNQKIAQKISEDIDFKIGSIACLNNIGTIYLQKDDLCRAKKSYEKSIKLCQKIGNQSLIVDPLSGLADSYIKENEIEKALEIGGEVLAISNEIGAKEKKGVGHSIIGKALMKKEELCKAIKEFEKGKKTFNEVGAKGGLAELLFQYAQCWKKKENEEKFKKNLEKAKSLFEDMGMALWVEKCEEL